jgi:hypothetical protein
MKVEGAARLGAVAGWRKDRRGGNPKSGSPGRSAQNEEERERERRELERESGFSLY